MRHRSDDDRRNGRALDVPRWVPRFACLLAVAAAGGLLATQAVGQSEGVRDVTTTTPATTTPAPDPPPARPKPKPKPKPRPAPRATKHTVKSQPTRRARAVTPPPAPPPPPPPPPVVSPPPPPAPQPAAAPERRSPATKKHGKRKHDVLAARHRKPPTGKRAKAVPEPKRAVEAAASVAAPAVSSGSGSGRNAIVFVVAALMALSLILIATAAVPPWVLPDRVGPMVARRRGDLANAGITGAICLLFAFLIAWMS